MVAVDRGAVSGPYASGVDEILDGDRKAVEEAQALAGGTPAVSCVSLGQCPFRHEGGDRVELLVDLGDAGQKRTDDLTGRDGATRQHAGERRRVKPPKLTTVSGRLLLARSHEAPLCGLGAR